MKRFSFPSLVVVFCALSAGEGRAQRVDPVRLGEFQRVLILPDTSGSLDEREYDGVVAALREGIPNLVRVVGAEEIGLLPWASSMDALRSASWFSVPRRHAETPVAVQFTEGESIFRGAHELRLKRETELREARVAEVEQENRRSLEEALSPFLVRLGNVRQGRAACTDVWGMLERCGREQPGTLCLLVTDGEGDCPSGGGRLGGLPAGSELVVILTPTRRAATASDMDARVRWFHEVAPWACIVFSFQVAGGIDQWLAPAQAKNHSGMAERQPGLR